MTYFTFWYSLFLGMDNPKKIDWNISKYVCRGFIFTFENCIITYVCLCILYCIINLLSFECVEDYFWELLWEYKLFHQIQTLFHISGNAWRIALLFHILCVWLTLIKFVSFQIQCHCFSIKRNLLKIHNRSKPAKKYNNLFLKYFNHLKQWHCFFFNK